MDGYNHTCDQKRDIRIRAYKYQQADQTVCLCNGLKTGSTSNAGFCVSATAEKDGVELIAVIMGRTIQGRFQDAVKLLDMDLRNVLRG